MIWDSRTFPLFQLDMYSAAIVASNNVRRDLNVLYGVETTIELRTAWDRKNPGNYNRGVSHIPPYKDLTNQRSDALEKLFGSAREDMGSE
jgi:hypothetical protein